MRIHQEAKSISGKRFRILTLKQLSVGEPPSLDKRGSVHSNRDPERRTHI